jgi:hypothetical protein
VMENHNPQRDFCPTPDAVAAVQIELKIRNLSFTGPGDWPYPTVFVDDVKGLKRGGYPFAWVYISQQTGGWTWLCSLDRDDRWQERIVYDSMRGFNVPTLIAPAEYLRHPDELRECIYPVSGLQWIEGETGCFREAPTDPPELQPSPGRRRRKAKADPDK